VIGKRFQRFECLNCGAVFLEYYRKPCPICGGEDLNGV
jgi:rRNA maturation endonuclease Nob1